MRIYLKPVAGPADLDEPLIMRIGAKVEDVCRKLHRDFLDKFRFARIWGDSVRHEAQRVGLHHTLADEDILQIVIER
jgi:ribosome-interacting GTPase 1